MEAEQKIMYKRLEALKLAEELGNITKVRRGEACRVPVFTNINGDFSNKD